MPLSRITPAIAPATALGRERVETFNTSAVWRSIAAALLSPTARAIGAAWDVLVVMRSSSGVVEFSVGAGWMVSESWKSRSIIETPLGVARLSDERSREDLIRSRFSARNMPLPCVIDGTCLANHRYLDLPGILQALLDFFRDIAGEVNAAQIIDRVWLYHNTNFATGL